MELGKKVMIILEIPVAAIKVEIYDTSTEMKVLVIKQEVASK